MGFLKDWADNRKINSCMKEHETLYRQGKYKAALKIVEKCLKEFPDNLELLSLKMREMIHQKNLKEIDKIVKKIQATPIEKIKKLNLPIVLQTDCIIKTEKDLNDENMDTIISDEELASRPKIKTPEEFIAFLVRRAFYLCLKWNGRMIHGIWVNYPAKQIRFLAELNIKYCPSDKKWVLKWFYEK